MIAPSQHHEIEDFSLVVDGPPNVHVPAADFGHHLIQVPPRRRRVPATLEVADDLRSDLIVQTRMVS